MASREQPGQCNLCSQPCLEHGFQSLDYSPQHAASSPCPYPIHILPATSLSWPAIFIFASGVTSAPGLVYPAAFILAPSLVFVAGKLILHQRASTCASTINPPTFSTRLLSSSSIGPQQLELGCTHRALGISRHERCYLTVSQREAYSQNRGCC